VVYNYSTGLITISGDAVVTGSGDTYPAIYLADSGTATAVRLNITGGTVSAPNYAVRNVSTGAVTISGGTVSAATYAVRNESTGALTISGGTVSATTDAVRNNSTGTITLRGNPAITGNIYRQNSAAVLNLTGTPTFAPASDRVYTLSYDTYTIGTVAVTGGSGFLSNFALADSSFKLEVSGSNLVVAEN
jgi:hypothetical protein